MESKEETKSKVYVVQLEKDKFYVGYTEREDCERLMEHFEGGGAKWTQKYKPVQVIEIKDGTKEDENRITLEYMKKYGWFNVRGGNWCKLDMERPPIELTPTLPPEIKSIKLVRERKKKPKKIKEEIEDPFVIVKSWKKTKSGNCFRCGRNGHFAESCYAKMHVKGYYIKS
jgi:predicted GIY-YIG superfamily endonuclease